MEKEKLTWLRSLIAKNNLHDFYSSAEWQALAAMARDRQHNECQRCRAKGFYSPCEIVHHRKHVKSNPELALSIENLECLCRNCHEEEHKPKKYSNEERW
ncbi:MAG: HNH endonuclease [Roseburia sp.]|nr:HNH endonuclease [Roseburia sp.]MCM1097799.1 HNH endonuclease [Ruminococcus flavefaciens]